MEGWGKQTIRVRSKAQVERRAIKKEKEKGERNQ